MFFWSLPLFDRIVQFAEGVGYLYARHVQRALQANYCDVGLLPFL